ncbi:MAG TPA: hypothetical protein VI197_24020 [Polyangiaceae bacterium]
MSVATPAVPAPPASEPSAPQAPEASEPAAAEPAAAETPSQPTGLAERYTLKGEATDAMAWLGIRNTYLVNQYVFVDGELMGWVPPGTEGVFVIPPGAHNVTLSDSEDGHGNAQVLAEVFDAGYSYYYDVVVR